VGVFCSVSQPHFHCGTPNTVVHTSENVYGPEILDREARNSISGKLWSSKLICKELIARKQIEVLLLSRLCYVSFVLYIKTSNHGD